MEAHQILKFAQVHIKIRLFPDQKYVHIPFKQALQLPHPRTINGLEAAFSKERKPVKTGLKSMEWHI